MKIRHWKQKSKKWVGQFQIQKIKKLLIPVDIGSELELQSKADIQNRVSIWSKVLRSGVYNMQHMICYIWYTPYSMVYTGCIVISFSASRQQYSISLRGAEKNKFSFFKVRIRTLKSITIMISFRNSVIFLYVSRYLQFTCW